MTRNARLIPLLVLALTSDCRPTETPKPAAAESASPAKDTPRSPESPAPAPLVFGDEAYACATDQDCVNDCAEGTLSRAWKDKHQDRLPHCKDGCEGPIAAAPLCAKGQCVSLDGQGALHLPCSQKRRTEPKQRCAILTRTFDELLARTKATCETAADCALYSAGVGKNCGGVTDKASAERLAGITKSFRAQKCPYRIRCAPRMRARPACRYGRCFADRSR